MDDEKKTPVLRIAVVIEDTHAPDCPQHPDNRSAPGPARVNSPAYKSGWDSVFGSRMPVGQA